MSAPNVVPLFSNAAPDRVYDRVFVGGGISATFAAYEYLRLSGELGRAPRILLMAPDFNAPCAAGNQVDLRVEGRLVPGAAPDPDLRLLLQGAVQGLKASIEAEGISCRLRFGYEMKARSAGALSRAVGLMIQAGVHGTKDIPENSAAQIFCYAAHPHSAGIGGMGQVNVTELLAGLRHAITLRGGMIRRGWSYAGLSRDAQGHFVVRTAGHGDIFSLQRPLLATGAEHMHDLPELRDKTLLRYTMGVVMGPLSAEDAAGISRGPMSFCDDAIDADFVWGGLDTQNNLTIGRGELSEKTAEARAALQAEIFALVESSYPGFLERYRQTLNVSFGPMLQAENKMPIVGRFENYDVAGGWGGFGIVPGFAAAQAFAQASVLGDYKKLVFFESMQPGLFKPGLFSLPWEQVPAPDQSERTGTEPL